MSNHDIREMSRNMLEAMVEAQRDTLVEQSARIASLESERDALRAEVERLRKPMTWQSIETAPEDMDRCVVVRWKDSEGNEQHDLDYTEDGTWRHWHDRAEHVEMIGGHGVSYTPPYRHWMPLPPAPITKGEA